MDSDSEASFLRTQVWGMFLQSLAFGFYLVTCGSCYRVFFTPTSRERVNWPMLVVFVIFLAKTTSSVAIHLHLNLQTVTEGDRALAAHQIRDGPRPIIISKYITILVQTVIASGFFIYRCWLVHCRAWLIVTLPLVLWCGAVALMGIVIHIDTSHTVNGLFDMSRVFGACFWGVIVGLNILTTGLIVYRVCRVDRLKSRSKSQTASEQSISPTAKNPTLSIVHCQPHDTMKRAIHIAIESGLMYTTMTLITFFLFVSQSSAVYAAICVLVPIIGISFNLAIVHSRPRLETSSLSELNSVPLQFTSSNMSVPASAIEFAFPKHFMPRRKNFPDSQAVQEDIGSLGIHSAGSIPQSHSQQSIH
ncbi:hypothetical protein B0H19DRAFT_522575 [Mycena capillaripes]|nr:hypothetical protein B0H19DRAFT_522575 [Mycena capillaripes]